MGHTACPEKRQYWSLWQHIKIEGMLGREVRLECNPADRRRIAKAVRKERHMDMEFRANNPGWVLRDRATPTGMIISLQRGTALPRVRDADM